MAANGWLNNVRSMVFSQPLSTVSMVLKFKNMRTYQVKFEDNNGERKDIRFESEMKFEEVGTFVKKKYKLRKMEQIDMIGITNKLFK
jgi:hypothetical protein